MFEVYYISQTITGDFKIIHHPTCFGVGDSFDHFCVNHYLVKNKKIWNVLSNFFFSVSDVEFSLLLVSNFSIAKLNNKTILIGLFMKTVTDSIVHIDRITNE